MFKLFFALILIATCFACQQNSVADQDENKSTWVDKDYKLEELIFEFQEMILPEMFERDDGEKWPWLCQAMTWSEYKVTAPDSINSETKFFKCRNEPGSITPAIYFCTVVRTANSDGEFCKDEWNALNWSESMVTNYSDEKCAQLMLSFVEEALIDERMNDAWQTNKTHWIKALNKIANNPKS